MKGAVSYLLRRSAMHASGAVVIGILAGILDQPKSLGIFLLAMAVKELFIDPHPSSFYWWKSLLDMAVWAGITIGTYVLYGVIF